LFAGSLMLLIMDVCMKVADWGSELAFHPMIGFDFGVATFTTTETQMRFATEQGYPLFQKFRQKEGLNPAQIM
jgi:hypothetical protein